MYNCIFPSVLGHCWLGDRKGIRPVKLCVSLLTGALHVLQLQLLPPEREREIYLHEKNCRQPKGQMPINAGAYFKSDNQ